jgi:hypothetical protein
MLGTIATTGDNVAEFPGAAWVSGVRPDQEVLGGGDDRAAHRN